MRLFGTPFSRASRKLSRRWLSALSSIFRRRTESFSKSFFFIYTIVGSGRVLPDQLDTTPVTTLTGRRLPGPSGFLPPSLHLSWRDQSKPPPRAIGKAAMLSMTRQQAYEINVHA